MAKIKHLSNNPVQDKSMETAKKYLAEENYVDAKDEVEKILDGNPADDRALNLLAIIMLKLDQYSKAVKIYEELILRYPNTMPLRTNLGVAYLKSNQPENALKEFSVVLTKDPGNKTVLKLNGKALLKLNRVDEAIDSFKKAGMNDYVKKIKKHGPNEPVVSELTTEDIMQEAIGKDKAIEPQEEIPGEDQVSEQDKETGQASAEHTQEEGNEEIMEQRGTESAEDYEEEQIIETERGPSAIDEQEFLNEEAAVTEETEKEESFEEEQPAPEKQLSETEEKKPSGKARADMKAPAPAEPQVSTVQTGDQEAGKPAQKTSQGLSAVLEETSLSKFATKVNFINESMLLFNLDGNLIYVRNKGIIALTDGLTIEQAYKRYRGKDTKSFFAERKEDPIVLVYGKGALILKSDFKTVKLFNLKNEAMFLDDEKLVAFQGDLEWENGRVELQADKSINVTQIRGTADVYLGLSHNLLSIRVSTDNALSVRLNSLIGWHGKLIPKPSAVKHYTPDILISFYGEGVVFIDA